MQLLRPTPRHVRAPIDAALVLALAGSAQYEIWRGPLVDDGIPGPRAANAALLLAITLPLLWRRRFPVAVFAAVLLASGLQIELIDRARSDQPPVQHWLALLVAVFSLAAHASRRRAFVAGAVGGAALAGADALAVARSGYAPPAEMVPAWFLLAAAFGLGLVLRGRRIEATFHAERAERVEREREQQALVAVADERARIARELHDVVAHAMSVVVVQAQAAQRVLEGEQPSAREALASIETIGRQALIEMRRLLGVLRTEGQDVLLAPQPSLARLDALVEQVRDAGLAVETRVEGEPAPLPPGIDISAFRIVQEALTNALKHADAAGASVVVRYRPDAVELEVVDDGRGPAAGTGPGHGLVGMRERAELVGGRLESGPRNGGGYAVRARLPR